MSEFDPAIDSPSPEEQLLARLKLQRMVFGAFALVLVSLFALGLSAYRHMQRERTDAHAGQAEALAAAAASRGASEAAERDLTRTQDSLAATRSELAAAKCRMALVEAAEGNRAGAAQLLEQARALGPPLWWPLVAWAIDDTAPRFAGPEGPILCAASSGNGRAIGVVREIDEGLSVEIYNVRDGSLIRADKIPDLRARTARLLLDAQGEKWYVQTPDQVAFGDAAGTRVTTAAPGQLGACATPGFETIYEAAGPRGLIVRSVATGAQQAVAPGVEGLEVLAVMAAAGRVVFAASGALYELEAEGRAEVLTSFRSRPDRVALHHAPGAVFAALLRGRELELLSIDGAGVPAGVVYTMPEEDGDITFIGDGTAAWLGRAGRVVLADFNEAAEWTLGGSQTVLVARHRRGLIFANRRGEISLRVSEAGSRFGRVVALLPPGHEVAVSAHGFVLSAPGGRRALQDGVTRALEPAEAVLLSRAGAVLGGERIRLPDGTRITEDGVLVGAMFDGSAVLYSSPRTLKRVSARSIAEQLLPTDRAPDGLVSAADAAVVAFRAGTAVYVTDLVSDAELVPGPVELAPDSLALEAGGTRLAVAYGPSILIRNLVDDTSRNLTRPVTPREVALLFGGTLLVLTEPDALVFVEVETGRELLRISGEWSGLKAGGGATLRAALGHRLIELNLRD